MAKLIRVSGTEVDIEPNNGTDFSLEELQEYVDGYIEVIDLNNGQIMVVNEDGKYTEDYNPEASLIAEDHDALVSGDFICGDVVVCDREELR